MTRSILITGCSSGIGADAAHTLSQRGWRVFASCRKAEDCARLQAEGLESPRLDYADADSIGTALAEVLGQTGGTLDAIFNNGAYAIPGAVEDLPRDALRAIFETNLFGQFDLINQAIPVMRRQGHGRIVNCSSVLGFAAMPWRGAYNATKFAMEGLTDTLRMEMADTPLHISLIEPGPIRTLFRKNSAREFERWIDWKASARAGQYENELLKRLYSEGGKTAFELPASTVTTKLIHALEAPRPRPRYFVTTPTYGAAMMKRLLPTRATDWLSGAR